MEYYFDTETTGFNFDTDEIITIQWQRLNGFTGEPIEKLNILKRWENPEKEMLEAIMPNLNCNRWDFVFVGKNLLFDFCLLNERMKRYELGEIDLRCLYDRAILDIKPILVLMNAGSFTGYDKMLPKTNPLTNDKIPQLYREGRYPEIVRYIEDETKDFLKAYQTFKKGIPTFRNRLGIAMDRPKEYWM